MLPMTSTLSSKGIPSNRPLTMSEATFVKKKKRKDDCHICQVRPLKELANVEEFMIRWCHGIVGTVNAAAGEEILQLPDNDHEDIWIADEVDLGGVNKSGNMAIQKTLDSLISSLQMSMAYLYAAEERCGQLSRLYNKARSQNFTLRKELAEAYSNKNANKGNLEDETLPSKFGSSDENGMQDEQSPNEPSTFNNLQLTWQETSDNTEKKALEDHQAPHMLCIDAYNKNASRGNPEDEYDQNLMQGEQSNDERSACNILEAAMQQTSEDMQNKTLDSPDEPSTYNSLELTMQPTSEDTQKKALENQQALQMCNTGHCKKQMDVISMKKTLLEESMKQQGPWDRYTMPLKPENPLLKNPCHRFGDVVLHSPNAISYPSISHDLLWEENRRALQENKGEYRVAETETQMIIYRDVDHCYTQFSQSVHPGAEVLPSTSMDHLDLGKRKVLDGSSIVQDIGTNKRIKAAARHIHNSTQNL